MITKFLRVKTYTIVPSWNLIVNMSTCSEISWRGVPLSEIYGSQSPWGAPEFPLVSPSSHHTVLYHVGANGVIAGDRPPRPQIGQDKWDHDYVRMPCSNQSLYPVQDSNGESHLKRRWTIIENVLQKPIHNSQDLANTILSYNTKFKNIWKFRALHTLFNEYLEEEETKYFFDVTLPEIAKLALALPKLIQSPIPLLKQHKNQSISLSQQQISSLLANAFFCTFPRRNTAKKKSEYASYPNINFNTLYEAVDNYSVLEKIKCICHYFRRVVTKVPTGCVTFSRRSVPPRGCPDWDSSVVPLGSMPLHVDSAERIEDAHGLIQVDFANKYLGGGVLNYGCVQEEIRFVICPELMLSMLVTEVLRPNEALIIIGCERYSHYTGYGGGFQFSGDFVDTTPRDSSGRRRCAVLAIDALPYGRAEDQYRPEHILREVNKAWVGFSYGTHDTSVQYPGVATGNWGCGAFGGSEHLKSLLQMMASAQARRPLAYYTFGDVQLRDDIVRLYYVLARNNVTVGQLYKFILGFCRTDVQENQLYPFILQSVRDLYSGTVLAASDDIPMPLVKPCNDSVQDQSASQIADSSLPANSALWKSTKHINESPELFSQGEIQSLNEVIIVPNETDSYCQETMSIDTVEKVEGDSKDTRMSIESNSNQTQRLFDEMKKLDESSGRLNLNSSHTSLCDQSTSPASKHRASTDRAMNEKQTDAIAELKKKVSRTIPFYFKKL